MAELNANNMSDEDNANWVFGYPKFSSWPFLIVIALKPLADAFYEIGPVKYLYMLTLVAFGLFSRVGVTFHSSSIDRRNKSLLIYIVFTVFYFSYLLALVIANGGTLQEIFKIISPFIFFIILAYSADQWMIYAFVVAALITILVNAALLPFDYGWVMWGQIKTFKGFYYFKTDLAYALTFSVIICSLYQKNKFTLLFVLLALLAAVELVLANSRMNYLTFSLVIIFIVLKNTVSVRDALKYAAMVGLIGLVFTYLYDSSKLLGFDTSNTGAFTQGRSVTWAHLVMNLPNFSAGDWLVGKGLFSDYLLALEYAGPGQEVHNAHNEVLHLIYAQGVVGIILYVFLWVEMLKMCVVKEPPRWLYGTATLAILIFIIQGITTINSSFATKTWPLVMVLFSIRLATWSNNSKHLNG